jgi:hypothetical protein
MIYWLIKHRCFEILFCLPKNKKKTTVYIPPPPPGHTHTHRQLKNRAVGSEKYFSPEKGSTDQKFWEALQ